MPFTPEELAALRPYAFHICGEINFHSIKSSRTLLSAKTLLSGTPHEHLLSGRRMTTQQVMVGGVEIEVRDHRPLAKGSLAFPPNYSLQDYITELNSRVFLWAGVTTGPVRSGRNYINRYSTEGVVYVLRVPTTALLKANSASNLEVTFCNSGAARYNNGLPANRGPMTFIDPANAQRSASKVVELTFKGRVVLPEQTTYTQSLQCQWLPF